MSAKIFRNLAFHFENKICVLEAEMAKNRVAELREQQYNLEMQELTYNHQQQREECEAAHIK